MKNLEALRSEQSRILQALRAVRQEILSAASRLLLEKRDRVFLGSWTVKDLLAHLAGWDFTNIAAVKASHRRLVEFMQNLPPEDFFKDWGVRYKGYKVIISRLLEAETRDETVHLKQIQTFLNAEEYTTASCLRGSISLPPSQ